MASIRHSLDIKTSPLSNQLSSFNTLHTPQNFTNPSGVLTSSNEGSRENSIISPKYNSSLNK
jgi:hypothetical protein